MASAPAVAQAPAAFRGARNPLRQRAPVRGVPSRASSRRSLAPRAKAVAEASEVTKANKAEWNSLGQVCAVLGSQWGDEGKGKLVDILAQVRFFASIARCGPERVGNRRDATIGVPSRRARVPPAPRAPDRISTLVAISLGRLSPPARPDRAPPPRASRNASAGTET